MSMMMVMHRISKSVSSNGRVGTEKRIFFFIFWLNVISYSNAIGNVIKQFHWSIAFTGQSTFYVLPCLKLLNKVYIFGYDYLIDR